jgi:phosphatidylinositol alpha-mannosyltransferase
MLALFLLIFLIVISWNRIHLHTLENIFSSHHLPYLIIAFGGMITAFLCRGESWFGLLSAMLPGRIGRWPVLRALLVGMAGSTVAPGRVGEAARSWLVTRQVDGTSSTLSKVVGTVLSQTLLNIVALLALGVEVATHVHFTINAKVLYLLPLIPILLIILILALPKILARLAGAGESRLSRGIQWLSLRLDDVKIGLSALTRPVSFLHAALPQWAGWICQWVACWALIRIITPVEHPWVAAAAILLAVNVSAIFPVTPSNLGVFQAATVAALLPFGVNPSAGFTYGIVLQGVEIICALGLGIPALIYEGFSWSQLRSGTLSEDTHQNDPSSPPPL